jgi:hypothetical protein
MRIAAARATPPLKIARSQNDQRHPSGPAVKPPMTGPRI